MADVWFATAYGLGRFRKRVVIKTIRPHLARDPDYIAMLINEASLAAQLTHPNIVPVFDLGCADGVYFIAMEYLPGRTMAQVLSRVRKSGDQVPTWLVLSVLASCCDGLQYAHDRTDPQGRPLGLLHHDLSPSNIMLSFNGNISILDFGVACATRLEGHRTRVAPGKYHYMAPERVLGQPADRRSDLYSLGVVMYQLLTQARPFDAPTVEELLHRIVSEPAPRPREMLPNLPDEIEYVVCRSMARQVDDRYPDAHAMGAALRRCLRSFGEIHEPSARARYLRLLYPEARESVIHGGATALEERSFVRAAGLDELGTGEITGDASPTREAETPSDRPGDDEKAARIAALARAVSARC